MSHVAFVIPTIDRVGGAERQVLLLAQGLVRRGWRVSVVALSGTGGDEAARLEAHGIPFFSLKMCKGLADVRGWIALNDWLCRERPDVLHAHLPHATWMVRWSRLFAPACVVVDTIHTAGTGTLGRRLGYRVSNWLTDQVTAVSSGAAGAWIGARVISARKLTVVPNGLDTDYWKPDAGMREEIRTRLGLRDEFLWAAAGRLEPVKDFSTLLRGFAQLSDDVHLMIAGDGSQSAALRALADSLGVTRRVHLMGCVSEILPLLQAADGFVLSSRWEGMPMSLLEACACALPTVSTDVAGAAEILGESAQLVPVQDPIALAAAMARVMLLSTAERAQIGDAARLRVQRHFSLSVALEEWEELYSGLIARKKLTARDAGASAQRSDADATSTRLR